MTYAKIKQINVNNKTRFYSSPFYNNKKGVFCYNCEKIKNDLFILSNDSNDNSKLALKTINDIFHFFITDCNYINNISLLRENKLKICITKGLTRLILSYICKYDNIEKIKYELVNDLEIVKGKISLLGGFIFLDYHDSIVCAVYNNIVYIYTDNPCSISLSGIDLFATINIENNLNELDIFEDN